MLSNPVPTGATKMKKIFEELQTWSVFNETKQLDFNGWYLKIKTFPILVDPPAMTPQDIKEVEFLGIPQRIYLTNKHHTRASAEHQKRWGSKIFIHEEDKPLMEIPVDGTFTDGEILVDELQVVRIPFAKTPGECAFFWPQKNVLILGDAIISPPQGLAMLSDDKFKDPVKARQGLLALRGLDFEILLMGDGKPILKDAKKIVEAFIQKENP